MEFNEAVEKVYHARGPLAGAAESSTHWLFSPAFPDPQLGPTFVNRKTGEIEQLSTDPRQWHPVLAAFRRQQPEPRPIPQEFYAEPEDLPTGL